MIFTPAVVWFAVATVALTREEKPDPIEVLTGSERTEHFEIRFRPGSRAEASLDRLMVMVEGECEDILEELDMKLEDTVRVFVYDSVKEPQEITGVAAGGFAIPLQLHIPHDNDQTRKHELVHVIAERLPISGKEPRNLFFAEGLANAMLRFVHGVSIDAVAAYESVEGRSRLSRRSTRSRTSISGWRFDPTSMDTT